MKKIILIIILSVLTVNVFSQELVVDKTCIKQAIKNGAIALSSTEAINSIFEEIMKKQKKTALFSTEIMTSISLLEKSLKNVKAFERDKINYRMFVRKSNILIKDVFRLSKKLLSNPRSTISNINVVENITLQIIKTSKDLIKIVRDKKKLLDAKARLELIDLVNYNLDYIHNLCIHLEYFVGYNQTWGEFSQKIFSQEIKIFINTKDITNKIIKEF